jgi:hypothetical protein
LRSLIRCFNNRREAQAELFVFEVETLRKEWT